MSAKGIKRAALLAAGLVLAACASTSVVDSWKEPGLKSLRFNKVLALAVVKNDSIRQAAEDALKGDLKNVQSVQSYKVLDLAELADNREQAKARLRLDGFDGVVALRLVGSEQSLGWTTAAVPLESFWGYYGYAYPPTEMRADTVVRVEVNIFSLTEDKVLWRGVSESFNPQSTGALVSEITAVVGRELRRQGLIS